MKRKHFFSNSFILFFLVNFSLDAQDIAPFQSLEPQAIEITPLILSKILGKTWHCITRKYVEKGKSLNRNLNWGNLKITDDGLFTHNYIEGTWYIENGKLLVLEAEREAYEEKENIYFIGGFSILKVDKHNLILRKTMTSNFDSEFTYFLESEERNFDRAKANSSTKEAEKVARFETIEQMRKAIDSNTENEIEQLSEKFTPIDLLHFVKEFNNKKGFENEDELEKISKEELIEKLKSFNKHDSPSKEKTDNLSIENLTKGLEKSELIHILKEEYFRRGIRPEKEIEEFSKEELREKLNNLNKN